MDLVDLGTPEQLWRRWVLLAAGHATRSSTLVEIRRGDGSARLETTDGWLRMRRLAGDRAVLWGHHDDLPGGPGFLDELLDSAPDWSFEVDSGYAAQDVRLLAWYAHGSWSSVPACSLTEVATLFAPVVDDAAVASWWGAAWPDATSQQLTDLAAAPDRSRIAAIGGAAAAARAARQLELAEVWAARRLSDAATVHLRHQIHAQMKATRELSDRGHPRRPSLLRQWAQVNQTGTPFRHAVSALRTASSLTSPGFVAGADDVGLDDARLRSLDNVLLELRMAETDEHSGAWLFARVTCDGRQVSLERAYDGWPSWYRAPAGREGTGPTMTALSAEMAQRTPSYRPGWSSLLPTDRY